MTDRYGPITTPVPAGGRPPPGRCPVSRSSAPAAPAGTATGRAGGQHPSLPLTPPKPHPPRPPLPPLRSSAAPAGQPVPEDAAGRRARRGRRLPHPPGKRAPLWLGALIAGAVVAALPAVTGSGPTDVATAADYGLGMNADVSGGIDDAGVRQ